jgi:hypothetical protein
LPPTFSSKIRELFFARRFENSFKGINMAEQITREILPSGKLIIRRFDKISVLVEESHSHGDDLDICISFTFQNGLKTHETYFAKKRMVSRKTYEKARINFPDMPPADSSTEDFGASLIRGAGEERKQWRNESKTHRPHPEEAQKIDNFCEELIRKGKSEDAVEWVRKGDHTLGEKNSAGSKRLVQKLKTLGCLRIIACEIDSYEDGLEHTEHLVVELPSDPASRANILDSIDRLASQSGYRGDFDDGQRYSYIKLD